MFSKRNTLIFISSFIGLGVLVVVYNLKTSDNRGAIYRQFASPDGRYKLVAFELKHGGGGVLMPGQGSDAPGIVCLFEMKSNKLLKRKPIEMLQDIDQIKWTATNVEIKSFADWELPN